MSSSSEKPQRRHTVSTCKRSLNFCSTPLKGKPKRPSSISISGVDSNPSSAKEQSKNQILVKISDGKQKRKKKKVQQKTSKLKGTVGGNRGKEKKKEKRKKKCKTKKSIVKVDPNTDWETCNEDSRLPPINKSTEKFSQKATSGSDSSVLFKDLRSPERIREAPCFVEDRLLSPILLPRAWDIKNPERLDFKENEGKLPVKNLPFSCLFDDSDDEEDALCLKKENVVNTYLGLGNRAKSKNDIRIEKCKQWLVNVSVPTTSSDVLWDEFVKNNCKDISRYLVSTGNTKKSRLKKYRQPSNENEKDENSIIQNDHEERSIFKEVKSELPEDMDIVRGYWDKSSQKWVRVHYRSDVYNFLNNKEDNFGGMTLNQFLQKCRDQKEQNTKKNVKDIKSNPNNKRKRTKSFFDDFESKRSRTTIANVSNLELQRINQIRRFALRLKKKRMMVDNEIPSTSKDINSDSRIRSLKRVSKNELDDREKDKKRLKLIKLKDKPTIKSIEILNGVKKYKVAEQK
ncbi:uncharacterized protein LOC132913128 isoform X2 [Bombus pascuorum]|uniref:uncharacterized protein LOC132913128 isoform X2 n=1 Tax=Bombus pascuorum TaxID=65598 RepID=UPI00298DB236|nr:uncharacterized protein LOC132913128 isoform X2 [Bombus pascuorum]